MFKILPALDSMANFDDTKQVLPNNNETGNLSNSDVQSALQSNEVNIVTINLQPTAINNSEVQQQNFTYTNLEICETCSNNFRAQIQNFFKFPNPGICNNCNTKFDQRMGDYFQNSLSVKGLDCKENCKKQLLEFLNSLNTNIPVCNNCKDNFKEQVKEHFRLKCNDFKKDLEKFFKFNADICTYCKTIAENANEEIQTLNADKEIQKLTADKEIQALNALYANEKREKVNLWKDCILNWEITEGPNYFIEDGQQFSFLKINRWAKRKLEADDASNIEEKFSCIQQQLLQVEHELLCTIDQQPSFAHQQFLSIIDRMLSFIEQQILLSYENTSPVVKHLENIKNKLENIKQNLSSVNRPSAIVRQPSQLEQTRSSTEEKLSGIEQKLLKFVNIFPLKKKEERKLLDISRLTHISFRRKCCLQLCCYIFYKTSCYEAVRRHCHCYLYSHHAIVLHPAQPYILNNKYHIIESSGSCRYRPRCIDKCCSKIEYTDKVHDPCCLWPFTCSTRNVVIDLSDEDFDVVIYKQTDSSGTLQTLMEQFENNICCICKLKECRCCNCWSECPGYCLCINNCEHLAIKSKTGLEQSHQVKQIVDKCCIHLVDTMPIYFLRFMLIIGTLLYIIDSEEDYSLLVDIFIHLACIIAVLISQLASLRKNIQEQRRFKNEVMSFTKANYYCILAFRLLLFLLYSGVAIGNITI